MVRQDGEPPLEGGAGGQLTGVALVRWIGGDHICQCREDHRFSVGRKLPAQRRHRVTIGQEPGPLVEGISMLIEQGHGVDVAELPWRPLSQSPGAIDRSLAPPNQFFRLDPRGERVAPRTQCNPPLGHGAVRSTASPALN